MVSYQLFEKGTIYKTKNSSVEASLYDGHYYPRISYKLTLEKIICNEESDGLGSDDVWLSYVVGTARDLGGIKKYRWRSRDFDTGEDKAIGNILYQGDLPDSISFSILGLEVDGTGDAQDVLNRFEMNTENFDKNFAYSYNDINKIIKYSTLTGAAGGAGIGAIIGVEGVVLVWEVNGIVVGSIVLTATEGGFVVGGVIGVVAGLLVGLSIAAIVDSMSPELLITDKIYFMGASIACYADKKSIPSPWETSIDIDKDGNKLKISVSYSRDTNGDLIEQRHYRSSDEDSEYTLVFRHSIG
jgi:hypothetical protein